MKILDNNKICIVTYKCNMTPDSGIIYQEYLE